jgi:glucokinase
VQEFLAENRVTVEYASFGVAGPVVEGRARITNLPWVIEEKKLRAVLNLSSVRLLNDLEATATAVPFLEPSDLQTLNAGGADSRGSVAVIAPGTGLGEAFITWEGSEYRVRPSEGGHADFAPTNQSEVDLLRFLLRQMDHVSYETVCSGYGMRNIHAYLEKAGPAEPASWHKKELEADNPIPVIADAALNKSCEICVTTLRTFVSILGAEAGNLALKVMATRGIYVGGGIPPRIMPALQEATFLEAFRRKGRMSQLVSRFPVHVILNPRAALLGAARSGVELLSLSPGFSEGKQN